MSTEQILILAASLNTILIFIVIFVILYLRNNRRFIYNLLLEQAEAQESQILSISNSNKENYQLLSQINTNLHNQINSFSSQQHQQMESIKQQLFQSIQYNEAKLEKMRESVDNKLSTVQQTNQEKLEHIRLTVEEKLHDTLEKRLGQSFKLVSDRLEQVHQGLGEMQNLASGVGDLRKILSNVKTRGVWGETQLKTILEQLLSPEQYAQNVATKYNSQARVEFAIKLPGNGQHADYTWLPIDAKFPLEDYQKLLQAREEEQKQLIDSLTKSLETSIKKSAKDISDKYLNPPNTTDFALMFLPIEGLYAEVLQNPGLVEHIQSSYKIVIASPTTLSALLNSLQMGFRTLAIEKRSHEVWSLLSTIKTEFYKFAAILNKTKAKLDQASKVIDDAEVRTRVIQRHLNNIEKEPHEQSYKEISIANVKKEISELKYEEDEVISLKNK